MAKAPDTPTSACRGRDRNIAVQATAPAKVHFTDILITENP
jgi:hypothetical protein